MMEFVASHGPSKTSQEGVAWVVRSHLRELTAAEKQDLCEWLADPENRKCYLRIETVWRLLGGLAGDFRQTSRDRRMGNQ